MQDVVIKSVAASIVMVLATVELTHVWRRLELEWVVQRRKQWVRFVPAGFFVSLFTLYMVTVGIAVYWGN